MARGARRPRSRFAASTQLFTHCQAALFHGRGLETLSQVEITDSFRGLREDLLRMAYATYMCELVDEMSREKERQEPLFLLLLATLHLLGVEDEAAPLARAFELKLLAILGFRPQLEACVHCGEPVSGAEVRFSPNLGGLLGPQCPSDGGSVLPISRGTLEAMRHLLTGDLRRAHVLHLDAATAAEMERTLEAYIEVRLEKRLKSREFLRQIAR